MNVERIRRRLYGGGFKPFRLCLSDGTKIRVPHPEFVALGRNVVLAVDAKDRTYILDPLHIVALEDVHRRTKSR